MPFQLPTFVRRLLCAVVFTTAAAAPALGESAAPDGADCGIVKTAIDTASSLRGLKPKHAVPCRIRDHNQVEQYLRETLRKKMPEKRLRVEERAYKLLGLIPPYYDYVNGLVALYTDQIGGYYDTDNHYYAMASWIPAALQMPIAVHELTHALQDQNFDIDRVLDEKNQPTDLVMARSAMLEGDATAVMLDYTRRAAGQPPVMTEESMSPFLAQNIVGALLSPSLRSAPPALQAMLIFPYVSGLHFAHTLLRKGGYAQLDEAYKHPPENTHEILHPGYYLAHRNSHEDKLPDPALPPSFTNPTAKPAHSDTLGEFLTTTLLANWIPPEEASSVSSAWHSDRFALYHLAADRDVLVWQTEWDSAEEADRFQDALAKAYSVRFATAPVIDRNTVYFQDQVFGLVTIEAKKEVSTVVIGPSNLPEQPAD